MNARPRRARIAAALIISAVFAVMAISGAAASTAATVAYVPISGAGSSWSSNAIDQWRRNVQQYGIRINYASTGSSDGRNQFKAGTVDFGASEIPYGTTDNGVTEPAPSRGYAYIPDVAGGTSFMYNLQAGGKRITNLRLSGDTLTKIFTGVITHWNDPRVKADNPGLDLPDFKVVPVVRSDGSGSTAQFTLWMSKLHASDWNNYCKAASRKLPCGETSNYPVVFGKGFVAQPNSQGVAGYVAQTANVGTITYVEYSYAIKTGYPVAKILNAAGYYTEPTAQNVAVALLKAQINNNPKSPQYLTQQLDGVYSDPDPRTYPLSSYSYMIIPTQLQDGFTSAKGTTLAAFANYFLCEGQQQAAVLGYSPLPINLVQAGLAQVKRIPGAVVSTIDIKKCDNPTFSASGVNTLASTAPQPSQCDKKGVTQCTAATGGAKPTSTSGTSTSTGSTTTGSTATTGTTGTTATTGTTGATTGSTGDPSTTTTAAGGPATVINAHGNVSCDADTGQCQVVNAVPVIAPAASTWGISQSFVTGLVLLIVLFIVVPPIAVVAARRSRRS
jgi:phosphate ABC transporter phosphate-binding protein